jgi:hypothetical protein
MRLVNDACCQRLSQRCRHLRLHAQLRQEVHRSGARALLRRSDAQLHKSAA